MKFWCRRRRPAAVQLQQQVRDVLADIQANGLRPWHAETLDWLLVKRFWELFATCPEAMRSLTYALIMMGQADRDGTENRLKETLALVEPVTGQSMPLPGEHAR